MPSVGRRQLGEHEIADRPGAEGAQRVGIAIERMAAEIEAERVLFVCEELHLRPRRRLGQADQREALLLVAAAEEIGLSVLAIALRASAVLDRAVHRGEQARASERRAARRSE